MVTTVPPKTLNFETYTARTTSTLGNYPDAVANKEKTDNKKFTIYMVVLAMVALMFVKKK